MSIFKTIRTIAAQVSALTAKVDSLAEQQAAIQQPAPQQPAAQPPIPQQSDDTPSLAAAISALGEKVTRHDLATADLLATLEEGTEALTQVTDEMRDALAAAESANTERAEADAGNSLCLAVAVLDQLFLLRRAAEGDAAWTAQFDAVERAITPERTACGLRAFGTAGEKVNPIDMEIMEARMTDQPEQHQTIAEVYSPGYYLHGELLRKAQVAIWRLS